MYLKSALGAATVLSMMTGTVAMGETLTIATVNNGDKIRMQGLTDDFTVKTGNDVEWVTLEENVLRQRLTTDITTEGGAFDIMTVGMYETPIWGANGWLVPLDDLSDEYVVDDILPAMRAGLSHEGTLYAAPFYGEGRMIMYRSDLMEAAGMVAHDQVEAMAMADKIVLFQVGFIEQVGSPLELYRAPRNTFVAGFVGSPKMNLVEGPEASKHEAHTIGIRPEHISISPTDRAWEGIVGVSKHLGSDTFFRVKCDAFPEPLTVRASGELSLDYGAKIFLTPDEVNLHRFDAKGLRIA